MATLKSTAKAEATMRQLAENLRIRFAGSSTIDTVREAKDANGWPICFLSDGGVETAAAAVIALRIKGVDAVSKDSLGNDQIAYAPHALEVCYELTAANNPIATDADLLTAEYEAIKTGMKIQLKELANTTAVTESAMDAASPSLELQDLYWPTKGV